MKTEELKKEIRNKVIMLLGDYAYNSTKTETLEQYADKIINLVLEEGKQEAQDEKAENYCGNERPTRKTLCQLKKGHKGSHRAIIFWEGEK